MIKKLFNFIRTKGLVETIIYFVWYCTVILSSTIRITFYKLRRYDFMYSDTLYGSLFAQRSTPGSISTKGYCSFGDGAILKCFGKGKISIGKNVSFNENCTVCSGSEISIGDYCVIGPFVNINDTKHTFDNPNKLIREQGWTSEPIHIKKNVWIGAHVSILMGITIGEGAVIGAGAVVTKNVEPHSVVAGVPAKQISIISSV